MTNDDDRFQRFCEILADNPGISANGYDRLSAHGKPDRRAMERRKKMTWLQLVAEAKGTPAGTTDEESWNDKIQRQFSDKTGFIQVTSFTIHTLEQALEVSEVNLDEWEVERFTVNSWQVTMRMQEDGKTKPVSRTNYQVKVWLKPKVPSLLEESIKELIKEIPKFKPPKVKRKLPKTPFALEMALYDAHIGRLAWGKETEQGDYDLEIGADLYVKSGEENLNLSAGFKFSKVIFILGQDLMHAENYMHQTPIGGNILDVDSRLPKIYAKTKAAVLRTILLCREVAPVEVLWVPGNHDMHASFYISDVVKEYFRNDKMVQVDNTPPWRKARLWGNLLVGYTHDATIRATSVVNMLPQFWPELWGKSKYREWHTGHKHKKTEWKFEPVLTVGGVVIRQIPALGTIDAWHYQKGFTDAVPGGESFIWSKDNGICAHFTAYVGGNEQEQKDVY